MRTKTRVFTLNPDLLSKSKFRNIYEHTIPQSSFPTKTASIQKPDFCFECLYLERDMFIWILNIAFKMGKKMALEVQF